MNDGLYEYLCPDCGMWFEDELEELDHCLICGSRWKQPKKGNQK